MAESFYAVIIDFNVQIYTSCKDGFVRMMDADKEI
jgi:hypothetical protein